MLQWYCLLQSFIINNTVYHSLEFWGGGILRLFNPIAWWHLGGSSSCPLFLGGACLMLWLSILVFLVNFLFHPFQWRVWSHPSTGSEGPSSGGWEHSTSERYTGVFSPLDTGDTYQFHSPHQSPPCAASQRDQATTNRMHYFIWCLSTFYICAHRICHYHHKEQVRVGSRTPP